MSYRYLRCLNGFDPSFQQGELIYNLAVSVLGYFRLQQMNNSAKFMCERTVWDTSPGGFAGLKPAVNSLMEFIL